MWKACREQERKIQGIMHDHKKRAERKAAYFAEKFGDPMRAFSVVGLPASVNYDTAQYRLLEAGDSLMPWKEGSDLLVDRFDGRALIDIIPAAPTAAVRAAIEETEEERELVDALNYERFYMLVENTHGSAPRTEHEAVAMVARQIDEKANYLLPTQKEYSDDRSFYARAPHDQSQQSQQQQQQQRATDYSNVGLDYGEQVVTPSASAHTPAAPATAAVTAPPAAAPGAEGSREPQQQQQATAGVSRREWREREAEREKERRAREREERQTWNALGARFGIRDFYKFRSRDLRDQQRVEKEHEAKSEVKQLPRKERRRLKFQRLLEKTDPLRAGEQHRPTAAYSRRHSPTYDDYRSADGGGWSPRRGISSDSDSGEGEGDEERKEYITEFALDSSSSSSSSTAAFMPTTPPRVLSKLEGDVEEREGQQKREAITPEKSLALTPADRWRLAQEIDLKYNHGAPGEKRGLEERSRRDSTQGRDKEEGTTPAKQQTTPAKEAKSAVPKKETPQDRLKRLMRQKLNKQIEQDKVTEDRKKEEREKEELMRDLYRNQPVRPSSALSSSSSRRDSMGSSAGNKRSRSPSRSRSRSPPRRVRSRRSRSPSRSRSRSRGRRRDRSPRSRSRSRDRERRRRSSSRSRSRGRGGGGGRRRSRSPSPSRRSRSRSPGRRQRTPSRSRSRSRGRGRRSRSRSPARRRRTPPRP